MRSYLNSIQLDHATLGTATALAIRDGAGGTVLWRCQLKITAPQVVLINLQTPLDGSPNTLLEVMTLTTVTGGVDVNAQGYSAP